MYLLSEKNEYKITRRRYVVSVKRTKVKDYQEAFSHIPSDAWLVDEDEVDGVTMLIFEQEQREPAHVTHPEGSQEYETGADDDK